MKKGNEDRDSDYDNRTRRLSSVTQIFRNGQTIIPTVKLQLNHYEPYEQLCLP
jgi:hypothetical protein